MTTVPNIEIRGIRQIVPSGFVVGRTSPGSGNVELIPISSLGGQLVKSGTVAPSNETIHTYLGFVIKGPVPIGAQFLGALSHRDILFPSAAVSSIARSKTAPYGNLTFWLVSNLASFLATPPTGAIASVAFTAGNATGVVTWLSSGIIAGNTSLYVVFPASDFDPTMANIELLFAGDLA